MTAYSSDGAVVELARAKVNLSLHVLGKRPDGYHELDSMVAFAGIGDELMLSAPAPRLPGEGKHPDGGPGRLFGPAFTIDGPFANAIDGGASDNLVIRAIAAATGRWPEITAKQVRLTKNLPVAAGVGGGSADAAAVLRALRRLFPGVGEDAGWSAIARTLGADVPVCVASRLTVMRGIGDVVTPLGAVDPVPAVLVNPAVPLATRAVFAALGASPLALIPDHPPVAPLTSRTDLLERVLAGRNDLEPVARRLLPVIGDVLAVIAASGGCQLARMSGSGPTCFGLFRSGDAAAAAAAMITSARPGWWVVATTL